MANTPTALYLQGGPGLNCAIERVWFGENYPVLWWDQPRFFADAENAYQLTLDAAAEKLAELHATQRKPIHVIGWSFGARLALDLAHRAPEAIGSLTLLAPSLCLETAFATAWLTIWLTQRRNADPPPFQPASSSNNRANNHARLHAAGNRHILSTPDLFSHYWAPTSGAQFARHSKEAACTRLVRPRRPSAPSQGTLIQAPHRPALNGPDHLRQDPHLSPAGTIRTSTPKTDIDFWKTLFPGSRRYEIVEWRPHASRLRLLLQNG
jgi:pimeloyl-ACP methyl ester carboxylesterase